MDLCTTSKHSRGKEDEVKWYDEESKYGRRHCRRRRLGVELWVSRGQGQSKRVFGPNDRTIGPGFRGRVKIQE